MYLKGPCFPKIPCYESYVAIAKEFSVILPAYGARQVANSDQSVIVSFSLGKGRLCSAVGGFLVFLFLLQVERGDKSRMLKTFLRLENKRDKIEKVRREKKDTQSAWEFASTDAEHTLETMHVGGRATMLKPKTGGRVKEAKCRGK